MIHNFTAEKSILTQYIAELRNVAVQQDKQKFRNNLIRIGQILAYEVSKYLTYQASQISTPLATSTAMLLTQEPVIGTILRAGLPLHQGVLNCFDNAENAFISAYRQHQEHTIEYVIEYISSPIITDKVLVMTDPMLATGFSMIKCLEKMIEQKGVPQQIHIIAVIASQEGVNRIAQAFPNAHIWCAAIDAQLNSQQYIIPGLGDAGDLAYGTKE